MVITPSISIARVGNRAVRAGFLMSMPLAMLALAGAAQAMDAVLEVPENMPANMAAEAALKVENGSGRIVSFELPEVEGLHWDRSGKQTYANTNGDVEESRYVIVRADAPGDYVIPPITVHLTDRTTVSTPPTTLHIDAGNANLTGNAYAEVSFEPATIAPGETTRMLYRIYLASGVKAEQPTVAPPAEAGAGAKNPDLTRTTAYDAHGHAWSLFTFAWTFTLMASGEHEIGGQQVIQLPGRDIFNPTRKTIPVKPGKLTVMTLPETGRPADFTGLIGPVELSATLERDRISAGEGTGLRIDLKGRQVSLAAPPKLQLPPGLTAYAKDTVDQPDLRSFRWDLVPAAPGTYVIPAIDIAYFDTAAHDYKRVKSSSPTLTVLPGRTHELTVSGAATRSVPEPKPGVVDTLAAQPLRGSAQSQPPPALAPLAFIAALAASVLAGLALRAAGRLRAPPRRGRELTAAIAAGDLARAAAALAGLRRALDDEDSRTGDHETLRDAARRLADGIDAARFGSRALAPDIAALARLLADRP